MIPKNPQSPVTAASREGEENAREQKTREAVLSNPNVKRKNPRDVDVTDLQFLANHGYYTEVSGDALARAKAGEPAKVHTEVVEPAEKVAKEARVAKQNKTKASLAERDRQEQSRRENISLPSATYHTKNS
jgi:hypothetical protein